MFASFKPLKEEPKLHPETISRFDKVERYGYVPQAVRIRAMLEAGENLTAIRTEMCDFQAGEEIDWSKPMDPVVSKNFDKFQEMETLKVMHERYNKLIATQQKMALLKELVDSGQISLSEEKQKMEEINKEEAKEGD